MLSPTLQCAFSPLARHHRLERKCGFKYTEIIKTVRIFGSLNFGKFANLVIVGF